jgi:SAM-dependent methyltransferase
MASEDPLAGSPWSRPSTVAGFVSSPPNSRLLDVAGDVRAHGGQRALDIGCGAGRNAIPLGAQGWRVLGLDLSLPMVTAARDRASRDHLRRLTFALAPMERLPVRDASFDLIVAHGIWNLARSGAQFRAAVQEAARCAATCGTLFVFTFSRNTLPAETPAVPGEAFVFTQFSGEPQVFLTEQQLLAELKAVGFLPSPSHPVRELNRRTATLCAAGPPVIYEGVFVKA